MNISGSTTTRKYGRLTLILGPMFSGKSTEMLRYVRKSNIQKKKTVVVKYVSDNRYTHESKVVTHDRYEYPAIETHSLEEILNELQEYEVVGIDEGQFFPDIITVSESLCDKGIDVFISALSGNFKREPFDNIARLSAKADKIKHFKAVCFYCSDDAPFSMRCVQEENEVLIGGIDIYKPVCRKCYEENHPQS